MDHPILQFGTGRFLQAHVDLFVAEALRQGQALGRITVVQSTESAQSSARAAVLADGYRVELRGMKDGVPVETSVAVDSIQTVWHANRDWPRLRQAMAHSVRVIVSNTADMGFVLDERDQKTLLTDPDTTPRSYPAKLLVLLHHRWLHAPELPLCIYPCELVSRNGDTLQGIVRALAGRWNAPAEFDRYLHTHCVWVNSLVDRIVSTPLEPAGAVAEPYALWALERQPRMVLPCTHPALVVTDSLEPFEQRKLWLLNLGHTFLVERWQALGGPADMTVEQAMHTPALRNALESVWLEEVLPVLEAEGTGKEARTYLPELRDRLLNPFLHHRLSDIAKNHDEKKQRRMAPVVKRAEELKLPIPQTQLRKALAGTSAATF